MNALHEFLIGWDNTLSDLVHRTKDAFPPQNISTLEDGSTEIQLALAGYKKEDLQITVEENVLKVSCDCSANENKKYISRGIARRKFRKSFMLNRGHEVKSASMEDGLLTILISPITPKKDAPKLIHID
jgi:molecular chaperone IbpA